MIFHVIAAMAEFERAIISERTIAGIAAARTRGQGHGRRRSLADEQCAEAFNALFQDRLASAQVAVRYNVHPRTLMRCVKRLYGPVDARRTR
jgi:DNA invertase Pin-like site-specific DNA recombinase